MLALMSLLISLTVLSLAQVCSAAPGDLLWADYYDRRGSGSDWVRGLAVSPDGTKLFAVGRTTDWRYSGASSIRVYDTSTGALLWADYYDREPLKLADWAKAVVVSPDGAKVFVACNDTTTAGNLAFSVRTYDTSTGTLLWEDYYDREGNLTDDETNEIAISGDGTKVVVVGRTRTSVGFRDFTVRTYDASTGALQWADYVDPGNLGDWAKGVAVNEDGSKVFVAGETRTEAGGDAFTVKAYNSSDGTVVWEDYYNRDGKGVDWAMGVAVSGERVFASGASMGAGNLAFTVRAYNGSTGTLLWQDNYDREAKKGDWAKMVCVSKDGTKIFVAGTCRTAAGERDFTVIAYDCATGTRLWVDNFDREANLDDRARAVVANGSSVFAVGFTETAAGGKAFTVRAYDAATGALQWADYYDREGTRYDRAFAVAVSPDGTKVFAGGVTATGVGGEAFTVRAYSTQ